jgi:hypothetical protein
VSYKISAFFPVASNSQHETGWSPELVQYTREVFFVISRSFRWYLFIGLKKVLTTYQYLFVNIILLLEFWDQFKITSTHMFFPQNTVELRKSTGRQQGRVHRRQNWDRVMWS